MTPPGACLPEGAAELAPTRRLFFSGDPAAPTWARIGPFALSWNWRDLVRTAMVAASLLLLVGCASTPPQRPVRDVSPRRHPNLAAAQREIQAAYDKIVLAQQANEWDMGGHAQKAKTLLDEANTEIKLAAETANEHR